jgi:2-oxo-3-hexenedioate decarboxylase
MDRARLRDCPIDFSELEIRRVRHDRGKRLHGVLFVGNRHAIAPRKTAWQQELANFRVELYRDGKLSQTGGGAFVLDSPLLALRHLVELLANDPHNPPLRAGEIISTGTLTLAMPVSAGESWTTRVHGIPLEDIALRIEA